MTEVLILIIGILSVTLFWRFRPPFYESTLLTRSESVFVAQNYINRIIGVDVSTWKVYSNYWYDHEVVNRMHQLDLLEKWRSLLFDWGIVESWRIRFVHENNSIVVNINANKEITFLHSNIRNESLYKDISNKISTSQDIINLLKQQYGNKIWSRVEATGEGERNEDLSNIRHYWYTIKADKIRMKFNVTVEDDRITQINNDTDINTDDIQKVIRKEYRESALNLTSFIASLGATIVAVISLIYTEQVTGINTSLMLVGLMILSMLLTAHDDIKLSIVNAFDSRLTLRSIYTVGILSAFMGVTAYSFLTFILSLAGLNLANNNDALTFQQPIDQLFVGIGVGFICLALSTVFFYLLQKRGYLRVSPELSSRSTYLSGFKYRQSISMSMQSSLLEELTYRLLGVSLFMWLFNNELLALTITSVLWAFLHQGRGFSPPIFRWVQLILIGFAFGYIYLQYGFLAAFIAHFVHNFILTSLPLFDYKLSKRKENPNAASNYIGSRN
ncbi:CPBP family intramembrane glutamic endopeptidase [Massilibacterium senegalense]|uniref:CPBP family intramembrane glutamic endopeptidase n=1 Tax=Massilibacterium senegalense TaxID=1632858 RepID=UPI000785FD25|nr:type II CAAX endopeptidase family protein [Massilibacterium senegalense]